MAIPGHVVDGLAHSLLRRFVGDQDDGLLLGGAETVGMLDDRFQRNVVLGHALGDRRKDADAVMHGEPDEIAAGMRAHLRFPVGREFLRRPAEDGAVLEAGAALGDIGDIANHARLKFHHTREYNTLQKLAYGGVLFVLLPLMILTGLAMSPSMNSVLPFLNEVLGGRQTARTIHFTVMALLVMFFIVHMLMILAAGPINELRSIITGWYRTDAPADGDSHTGRDA